MHRLSVFHSVLVAVVLLAWPAVVAAQDPPPLHDQEQLVKELLRRLDTLEAGNAALLQRLAILEAAQKAGPAITASDGVPSGGSEAQPPEPGDLASVAEQTTRLEKRLDALPKVVGYYDFEFFKEGLPGTFGEFRQHHLFLDFSKEYRNFACSAKSNSNTPFSWPQKATRRSPAERCRSNRRGRSTWPQTRSPCALASS